MSLALPAAWHFSMSSAPRTGRCPVSALALLSILVIVTFIIVLYFSRNETVEEPVQIKGLGHSHVDAKHYHFGIVVDAGSSGSRLFIYAWPTHGGDPGELLRIRHLRDGNGQILVKKIEPGLSSLEKTPNQTGRYLRPLLEYAREFIPQSKMAETPVYVLATAGMRLLPSKTQDAILESVRHEIRTNYKFLFNDNQVTVITGKQEGIFAWIAVNYVLGKFTHHDHPSGSEPGSDSVVSLPLSGQHERRNTLGIIDMGGGSAQIAYEVGEAEKVKSEHLAEFNLGCRTTDSAHQYRLYVTTFLQYGTNSARMRYEQMMTSQLNVMTSSPKSDGAKKKLRQKLVDPCLPRGLNQTLLKGNAKIIMQGSGDYERCCSLLTPLLNLSSQCARPPCTISGQHLAPINFTRAQFIGFSEYFYSTEGLLNNDGMYDYKKFKGASKMYCSTSWSVIQKRYRSDLFNRASADRRRSQCFKAAWVTSVLHDAFHFPREYDQFKPIRLVRGKEVQWTLGALLYKTRYFPLREVQRQELSRYHPPWKLGSAHGVVHHYLTQYFLSACILLVLLAIILYTSRLRRIMGPRAPPAPPPSTAPHYQTLPGSQGGTFVTGAPEPREEVVIVQGEVFRS